VWFAESTKKRKPLYDLWDKSLSEQESLSENERQPDTNRPRKRRKVSNRVTEPALKNLSLCLPVTEGRYDRELIVDDALAFLGCVKTKISVERYRHFLELITSIKRQNLTIQKVCVTVSRLFDDNQLLLDRFSQFLPEGYVVDWHARHLYIGSSGFDFDATIGDDGNYMTELG